MSSPASRFSMVPLSDLNDRVSARRLTLTERRIWFWQHKAFAANGWCVRRPGRKGSRIRWHDAFIGLFRLTAARFEEVGHVDRGVVDRLQGSPSPLGSSLGGELPRAGEKRSLSARLVHQFLEPFRRPALDDIAHRQPAQHPKPVEYRQPKLTIDELLQLNGYAPIQRLPPSPEIARRVALAAARKGRAVG